MFGISHRLKGNRRANETGPDTAILQPVVLLLLAARSRFGERRLHKHNCCSSRTRPLPSRVTFYFGKEEPTLKRGCCCMFSCSRLGCLYYSVPCPGNANCRRRRGSNRAIPSSCRPRRPASRKEAASHFHCRAFLARTKQQRRRKLPPNDCCSAGRRLRMRAALLTRTNAIKSAQSSFAATSHGDSSHHRQTRRQGLAPR